MKARVEQVKALIVIVAIGGTPLVAALVGACDKRPAVDKSQRSCVEVAEDAFAQCTESRGTMSPVLAFEYCNDYSLQMFEACQREKNCTPLPEASP